MPRRLSIHPGILAHMRVIARRFWHSAADPSGNAAKRRGIVRLARVLRDGIWAVSMIGGRRSSVPERSTLCPSRLTLSDTFPWQAGQYAPVCNANVELPDNYVRGRPVATPRRASSNGLLRPAPASPAFRWARASAPDTTVEGTYVVADICSRALLLRSRHAHRGGRSPLLPGV